MPRYMIERNFPTGLPIRPDQAGLDACREVVERNAEGRVRTRQLFPVRFVPLTGLH